MTGNSDGGDADHWKRSLHVRRYPHVYGNGFTCSLRASYLVWQRRVLGRRSDQLGERRPGNKNVEWSQQATYSTCSLSGGSHDIFAVYGGDTNFDGNQGDVMQTVSGALHRYGDKLTDGMNPSRLGDPLTFKASVTSGAGTPDGTVQFYDGDPASTGTRESGPIKHCRAE